MKWYTRSKADDLQGLVIEEETGRNVAVTYDPKDAPLVAAAPELLSALKDALEVMGSWDYEGDPAWAQDARTAIRKAEGE